MRNPRTAMKSVPCSPQLEKTGAQQRRSNAAKNKISKLKKIADNGAIYARLGVKGRLNGGFLRALVEGHSLY